MAEGRVNGGGGANSQGELLKAIQRLAEVIQGQGEVHAILASLVPTEGTSAALAAALTPPSRPPEMEDKKWVSPEGQQLLGALGAEFQTVKAIANRLGWTTGADRKPSEKLRILLHEYVERGCIEERENEYRLPPCKEPAEAGSA